MTSRGSFAPAILGKVGPLRAFFAGVRASRAPGKSDARQTLTPAVAVRPTEPCGVSINHLPRPGEFPIVGLDKTG